MRAKIAIILLNWNGKTDTLECLESLQHLDYPDYEIIVVDNGSSDDSVQCISRHFPTTTLIALPENLGFTGGNNRGIQYALGTGCEYILLLNNDTTVDPAFLTHLVAVGDNDPEIGMLNPMIYRSGANEIWFGGGRISWKNGVTNHLTNPLQVPHPSASQEAIPSDYVTGCALLVKTGVIERIGLLDSRFFAYYEDTDWSVRCQKAGWKTVVVPKARIWHKVSATAPAEFAFILAHRNMLLFLWKHSPFWKFLFRFRRAVFKCLHEFTWNDDKRLGEAAMHGVWSAITFRFGKDYREMPAWMLHFIEWHKGRLLKIFGWEQLWHMRKGV